MLFCFIVSGLGFDPWTLSVVNNNLKAKYNFIISLISLHEKYSLKRVQNDTIPMILSYRDTSGRHYYDLLSLLRDPWSTPNPAVTKQRRWKHFTLHHTRVFIMSLSSAHAPHTVCPLSISRIVLIRRLKPETRCFHTWLLRVSVLRQKEIRQGGNHLIFFSFFSSVAF